MSMHDCDGWIWFDGALKPWRDAATHVLSHTLHYGLGVFEGLRVYQTARGPAIFRLADHTARLTQSAHILGIKLPYSKTQLEPAQCEVVRSNRMRNGDIRPLVFLGSEKMGVNPDGTQVHVAIAAWPWARPRSRRVSA